TAAITLIGTAVILLTNRYWPGSPTHISNFLASQGRTAGGIAGKIWDRLAVGIHLISRDPFALVPVIGVPATLWFVFRPPAEVRDAFASFANWREALVATLLASAVAYVVNDSGPAALGLGFGMAMVGLVYAACRAAPPDETERVSEQRPAPMMEST